MRRRQDSRGSAWLIAITAVACGAPERPPDTALYDMALARARVELQLPASVQLHPFPFILNADAELRGSRILDFNTFDSTTVPRLVRADPASYRVCEIDVGGSCQLAEGEVAIVVSNLLQVERDAVGLVMMVADRREARFPRRYYTIRMKHSLGDWQVVEFEPMRR